MRKYLYILLLAIAMPNIAWGIGQHQYYYDTSEFPEAFEWDMIRYDYRGTDEGGNPVLVNTAVVKVIWDPSSYWVLSSVRPARNIYGKLTIQNFYSTPYAATPSVSLVFENRQGRHFEWSADKKTCTFSFASFYWSRANSDSLSIAVKNDHSYAFVSSLIKSNQDPMSWWMDGTNSGYKYGNGGHRDFVIDMENKTITTNAPWGCIMMKSQNGGSSTLVEPFDFSVFQCITTDLVDIVNDPEIHVGDEVTVDDDLLAVALMERNLPGGGTQNVLIAKDFNKYLNPDVNTRGADDFLARTVGPVTDQSNWVALTYDANPAALRGYQGLVLKGGSIKGTLTDKTNPAISLSALPTEGEQTAYTPNTYIVPSFCDEYASDESAYFFVQPKPQEYCYVMWADYNAATNAFYVPAVGAIEGGNGSISNPENLSGGFGWSDTYLRPGDSPIDRQVFSFNAVVNKISYTDTYNVWVHTLNGSDQLMEDGNTRIYAWKGSGDNKTEYCGAWPGTPLTEKRTDSTGGEWYYYSFGNTCPDGIIFNYPDKKQSADIKNQLVAGDNFFNYYPEGGDQDNRYWNLTSQYSRQSAPRRAQQHDPKVGALSERYVVMPLKLDVNSVVTAVADVHSEATVASVRYVDAMGRVSATPHRGINIVVTRHTDGTTTTRKVVM